MNYSAAKYGVSEDPEFSDRSKLRGIGAVAIKGQAWDVAT